MAPEAPFLISIAHFWLLDEEAGGQVISFHLTLQRFGAHIAGQLPAVGPRNVADRAWKGY